MGEKKKHRKTDFGFEFHKYLNRARSIAGQCSETKCQVIQVLGRLSEFFIYFFSIKTTLPYAIRATAIDG